jgi:parallel beta-helix repeat protein
MKKFLLLFLLFITFNAFSRVNYYVDGTNGTNTNAGTSTTSAFKTIQRALTSATHGDVILVMPGVYSNATYGTTDIWKTERTIDVKDKLSASGQYLTIKPLTAGSVTLKGDGFAIIQVRNSSYIKIEGFNIEGEPVSLATALQYQFTYKDAGGNILERVPPGSTDAQIAAMTLPILNNIDRPTYTNTSGISVNGSHHVDLLNNIVSGTPGEGIRSFTSDFLNIIGNTVSGCSGTSAAGVHGMSVYNMDSNIDAANSSFTGVRILIARNNVYSNVNGVYSWSEQKTFITPHIDEGKGITVQRCTNGYLWFNGKIRIENNLSYNNGFSGVHINSGDRVEIVNNTCYDNNYTSRVSGGGDQHGISVQDGHDVIVANNIAQSFPAVIGGVVIKVGASSSNVTLINNVFYGNIHISANPISTNTQNVNPNFANAGSADFSLMSTSPAINVANATHAPTIDIYGNARTTPDIGAIEFQGALPVTLVDFKGNRAEKGNLLTWITAEEVNVSHYEVERSFNDFSFESIGKVNAKNKASVYTFLDQENIQKQTYYRLKMVDNDQSFQYSNTISLKATNKQGKYKIYPNPTTGIIIFETYIETEGDVQIEFLNAAGQRVIFLTQRLNAGNQNIQVDLSNLPKGKYLTKLTQNGQVLQSNKVFKN